MKLFRPLFAEAKSPRPFLPLLTLGLVVLGSGCRIENYRADGSHRIAEHVGPLERMELLPDKVCMGDRLNFKYEFFVPYGSRPSGLGVRAVCTQSLLPTGSSCEQFYPHFALTPSHAFNARLYAGNGYQGIIASDPLQQETRFEFVANVDPSSPSSYALTMSPVSERVLIAAYTFMPGTDSQRLAWYLQPLPPAPAFRKEVDPIDAGQTVNESVTFTPQCAGNALAWTPVSLETGTTRSASVGLTQICNRDRTRSVRYLITFESAPAATTEPVAPGECVSGMGESSTFRIRSLSVIPGIDPTVPVTGPPCLNSMNNNVPAPVVAQLGYACTAG